MSDTLVRIKRAILARRYRFSFKAYLELDADGLTELDALESIMSATAIYKTIRSTSPGRSTSQEKLHVIISTNLSGLPIYTKGKMVQQGGEEIFYFLISSKRSVLQGGW